MFKRGGMHDVHFDKHTSSLALCLDFIAVTAENAVSSSRWLEMVTFNDNFVGQ